MSLIDNTEVVAANLKAYNLTRGAQRIVAALIGNAPDNDDLAAAYARLDEYALSLPEYVRTIAGHRCTATRRILKARKG